MSDPGAYATPERKASARAWFESLRDRLCAALEAIENEAQGATDTPGRFEREAWLRRGVEAYPRAGLRPDPGGDGGTMAILRGRVFEKAGVNVSTVMGEFPEGFRARVPGAHDDPRFWASGVSVVIHPRSPRVPAAHMNTRFIVTTRAWFGGGGDLTPAVPFEEDTGDFHAALREACERFDPAWYPRFKQWCDEYFFLPHRGEPRGAGGIFFDEFATGDFERDFAFVRAVGEAFLEVYPRIVRRRMNEPWTEAEREAQLVKRGRYAEFNLLYDRGTRFGLETGGNAEAILMSLPPLAAWP